MSFHEELIERGAFTPENDGDNTIGKDDEIEVKEHSLMMNKHPEDWSDIVKGEALDAILEKFSEANIESPEETPLEKLRNQGSTTQETPIEKLHYSDYQDWDEDVDFSELIF